MLDDPDETSQENNEENTPSLSNIFGNVDEGKKVERERGSSVASTNIGGSTLKNLFGSVDEEESVKTTELFPDQESVGDVRRSDSFGSIDSSGSMYSEVSDSSFRHDSISSDASSIENVKGITDNEKLAKCIAMLKVVNDFVFDEMEVDKDHKSQARLNDEDRYQSLRNSVNNVISKYDKKIAKYGTNLDKYLNFVENITGFDSTITREKIRELSNNLQPEEKVSYFTRKVMKIRRAIMGFGAGFVLKDKDISQYNKLSLNEKKKVKLVQELVELEKNQEISVEDKQNRYDEINRAFVSLDAKEKRMEKKELLRIFAKQAHKKKLFSTNTVNQLTDKVLHPYTKIINRDDLSVSEKTLKVGAKFVEKAVNGGKVVVEKATNVVLDSGQSMIKHSVKQPAATVYRGSMAIFNAVEYLTLEAKVLSEEDPAIKENLRTEAKIKFQNMGYEGEKFVRAAAATVGIALVDTAVVATVGGIAAPAAVGISTSAQFLQGTLIASQVADNIQTARDGIDKINEGIDHYKEQKSKLTIQETRGKERRGALVGQFSLPTERKSSFSRVFSKKDSFVQR